MNLILKQLWIVDLFYSNSVVVLIFISYTPVYYLSTFLEVLRTTQCCCQVLHFILQRTLYNDQLSDQCARDSSFNGTFMDLYINLHYCYIL